MATIEINAGAALDSSGLTLSDLLNNLTLRRMLQHPDRWDLEGTTLRMYRALLPEEPA